MRPSNKIPSDKYWRVLLELRTFKFTVLYTHWWNTIRSSCLWQIRVSYDLFNQLAVTELLCSFRLVLEGKMGKGIPGSSRLEFLEKFLVINSTLSDREDNTSLPLKKGDTADLLLLRILLILFLGVIQSFVILGCSSLAASRTLLQWLLSCLTLCKKWFLWAVVAAQAAENHGDEWDLTCYLGWGIYTSIPARTHSQNSLAGDAPSLKISKTSLQTSLKWWQWPS